jgi:ferredoxin--NADP+ reductase
MDGPEFDGHKVDFDGMLLRMRAYRDQEHQALAENIGDTVAFFCRVGTRGSR